jgi:hypothetical protein
MTRRDLLDVAIGLLIWGSVLLAAVLVAGWVRP